MSIKPQLYKECGYAFDASNQREFYYYWSNSNNQSVSNILTIRNNTTNAIVYQQTQQTLLLKHVVPSNTLENGKTYNATIQVYDIDNVLSTASDAVVFKCLTTPTIALNVTQNQIIRSSSYAFSITYTQAQSEELQYYYLELYDSNGNYMYSTSNKYSASSTTIISELLDNSSYYVKAKGQTINHINVETSKIRFYIEYIKPAEYSYISVENRYAYGDIKFTSYIISIEGEGVSGTPVFSNGCVDTINGTAIRFDENFYINNGQLLVKGKGFTYDIPFLILKNSNNCEMSFSWKYGTFKENNDVTKWYVELVCKDDNVITIHHSNYISYNSAKFYSINIKIVNNYININVTEDST